MSAARRLLLEGLSDAVGFVGGALAGYGVSLLLGMDVFAEGYGTASITGILLVGLGCGLGRHLARRARAAFTTNDKES